MSDSTYFSVLNHGYDRWLYWATVKFMAEVQTRSSSGEQPYSVVRQQLDEKWGDLVVENYNRMTTPQKLNAAADAARHNAEEAVRVASRAAKNAATLNTAAAHQTASDAAAAVTKTETAVTAATKIARIATEFSNAVHTLNAAREKYERTTDPNGPVKWTAIRVADSQRKADVEAAKARWVESAYTAASGNLDEKSRLVIHAHAITAAKHAAAAVAEREMTMRGVERDTSLLNTAIADEKLARVAYEHMLADLADTTTATAADTATAASSSSSSATAAATSTATAADNTQPRFPM